MWQIILGQDFLDHLAQDGAIGIARVQPEHYSFSLALSGFTYELSQIPHVLKASPLLLGAYVAVVSEEVT